MKKRAHKNSSNRSSSKSSVSSSKSRSRSKSKSEHSLRKQRDMFDLLHAHGKMKAERIKEAFGYTNDDNDKMENLGKEIKLSQGELLMKQEEFIKDIEKVKLRRAERAIEKLKLDDQKSLISREKEEEIYEQWLEKEDNFHKEQAKIR